MTVLRVAGAQIPNRVGDLDGNAERIGLAMEWAEEAGADVLVLPELALTGYPLGDLVQDEEFVDDACDALAALAGRAGRTTTVVSTIDRVAPVRSWDTRERTVAIAAALLFNGEVRGHYHKVLLPAYDGFEEARSFAPGQHRDVLWRIGQVIAGVAICEDLWAADGPPEAQSAAGAQILLVPNASAYHRGKPETRVRNTAAVAVRNGVPVVYVNFVGAQDELVFDGGSLVVDTEGRLLHYGAEFAEDRFVVPVPVGAPGPVTGHLTNVHTRPVPDRGDEPAEPVGYEPLDEVAATWHALVTALRDYTDRNGFGGIALGLSGGIDSTVTAALATEAVGDDRVLAVTMPAPETNDEETEDAHVLAQALGVELRVLPLDAADESALPPSPADDGQATLARHYARRRAAALTEIAEEESYLLVASGNKSEISIGEAALYGDLVGGYAPLKDCPKTMVYELARYRNRDGAVIPERVLTRPTTAQVVLGDALPPYEVLDDIVQRYVERGQSRAAIVADGHQPDVVAYVLSRIDHSELTRRYAPPGVKLSPRAFGHDRRMPIINAWRHGRTSP